MGALLQSGAGSGLPPGTRVGELIGFVASLYPAPLASPAVLRHAGLASLAGRRAGHRPNPGAARTWSRPSTACSVVNGPSRPVERPQPHHRGVTHPASTGSLVQTA